MKTTTLTDEEVVENHNDLEMMRRPWLWSHVILHLKKRKPPEFAILIHNEDAAIWIMVPKGVDLHLDVDHKREGDESLLVQLVEEGWVVD